MISKECVKQEDPPLTVVKVDRGWWHEEPGCGGDQQLLTACLLLSLEFSETSCAPGLPQQRRVRLWFQALRKHLCESVAPAPDLRGTWEPSCVLENSVVVFFVESFVRVGRPLYQPR